MGLTATSRPDDFHYIATAVQVDVGRQIKTAAERGVRLITASVPHRSDDVVRSNHELRGRTNNIDLGFWSDSELLEIAHLGFKSLNVHVSESMKDRLARDACGSPQIMQRICLNVCNNLSISGAYDIIRYVADHEVNVNEVMAVTSTSTDFKTLVQVMHAGPKTRGTERAKFNFIDGSRGDVYRCILLAIAQDLPRMELPYQVLMERVRAVCVGESPQGRSVTEACKQISDFALQNRTVEFDTDLEETFYIADPYWLFYL